MARAAAAAGARVVLAARRRDRLEALAAGVPRADAIEADVAIAEDRRRLIETIVERHGRLDALVNNAGVSHTGPALRADRRRVRARARGQPRRAVRAVVPGGGRDAR